MNFHLGVWSYLTAAVIGLIIGYIGGPGWILAVWAIVGLVIGRYANRRRAALANGAIYGFALSYAFMVAGYSGSDPLTGKLAPFILFGIVGALCGAIISLIGRVVDSRVR
jgi:hypothetical protein